MKETYSKKALLEAVEITRGGLEAVKRHGDNNPMLSLLRQAATAANNPEMTKSIDDMLAEKYESVQVMVIAAETFALAHGCTQAELDAVSADEDIVARAVEKAEARK